MSSHIASKDSAFLLTEVSAYEMPAFFKKFVSKDVTWEAAILKLSWQPGPVHVTSFSPTRNGREAEKPVQGIIHFTILIANVSALRPCLAQNNPRAAITQSSSYKACLKPFEQNLLDGITPEKCGDLAAEYCSKCGNEV